MKRLLALFLCLVCALAAAPALAEEPLSFTMTSCASLTGEYADYKEDSLYKYVADKFNIDVDIWASGWDIRLRITISDWLIMALATLCTVTTIWMGYRL